MEGVKIRELDAAATVTVSDLLVLAQSGDRTRKATVALLRDLIASTIPAPTVLYGSFSGDEAAASGGVPIDGVYFLTFNNNYGMPEGVAKKRTQ